MDKVCILGTGRQGTAAAYDILLYAKPKSLLLLDSQKTSIDRCLEKIKKVKSYDTVIETKVIDLKNVKELSDTLLTVDIMLSSVPYHYNGKLTKIAINTKTSMVDLGGHTGIVKKQLSYDSFAIENNISIVPDCGMGPGMNVSMALLSMEQLDEPQDVFIWDGGLPRNPKPPWNYSLFFNIQGLTNEYDGNAFFIRNGNVVEVPCFEDFEKLNFKDIGELEAAVTSGGLSTMPWTFEGKINTLENKTLRYSGHWDEMRSFRQLGLFDESKIKFKNIEFSPREFYHHLLEPKLGSNDKNDICLMRTKSVGILEGKKTEFIYDCVETYDDKTGFMAMEKWTGWHASIVMQKIMDGSIKSGTHPIEKALSGKTFYNEAIKRGYNIKSKKNIIDSSF